MRVWVAVMATILVILTATAVIELSFVLAAVENINSVFSRLGAAQ